jgi:hypothetical protein
MKQSFMIDPVSPRVHKILNNQSRNVTANDQLQPI